MSLSSSSSSRPSPSEEEHATREVLLVTGMHRSGTSAAARVLSLLGAALPRHVMPALAGNNEAGFWEPSTIVEAHDELLESLGSAWDDVTLLDAGWFRTDAARAWTDRLMSCLADEYGDFKLAVVKDPRMCRLLPLWTPLVDSLPATPLFVIPYRHPLEVAGSLAKRDGFSRQKSLLLWLQHVLLAERETRGRRRAFVSYASLLANPRRTVERLSDALSVSWPREPAEALDDIEDFLNERLRNHRLNAREAEDLDVGPAARVFRIIDEATGPLTERELGELDAMRKRYLHADRLMGPLLRELLASGVLKSGASFQAHADADAAPRTVEDEGRLEQARGQAGEEARRAEAYRLELEHTRATLTEAEATQRRWLEELEAEKRRADVFRRRSELYQIREASLAARYESLLARLAEATAAAPPPGRGQARLSARQNLNAPERRNRRAPPARRARTAVATARLLFVDRTSRSLFDVAHYLSRYPEAKRFWLGARAHFVWRGAARGLDPHPLFDSSFYLEENDDAVAAGVGPLVHYVRWGARDERSPHPLFDAAFYMESQPELNGQSPLEHYLAAGALQGRNPHPLFDSAYYLTKNPDVAEAGMNPLVHFVRYGAAERRPFHPLFDVDYYLAQLDGEAPRENLLLDFLGRSPERTVDPHPLFASDFYLTSNPEAVLKEGIALVHFVRYGARSNLKPHPLFDPAFYRRQTPDAASLDVNPLVHYLQTAGRRADPHPLFQTAYYLEQWEEAGGESPLAHFLAHGFRMGLRPNPFFDPRAYLSRHPDVERTGVNPLVHFQTSGWPQHRSLGEDFDVAFYFDQMEERGIPLANPLEHYLTEGRAVGLRPRRHFDLNRDERLSSR